MNKYLSIYFRGKEGELQRISKGKAPAGKKTYCDSERLNNMGEGRRLGRRLQNIPMGKVATRKNILAPFRSYFEKEM